MRTLTGQVEQLTFQMQQLQAELQRARQAEPQPDAAAKKLGRAPEWCRLRRRSAAAAAASTGTNAGGTQERRIIPGIDPGANPAPGGAGAGRQRSPRQAASEPIDITPGTAAAAAAPAAAAPSLAPADMEPDGGAHRRLAGDPQRRLRARLQRILTGDYDVAETGFRQFLAIYPDDARAPDAQYWLGESLFARGDYREAADEFLSGYKAYPQSGKAPDTLLKLGLSLAGLGEREAPARPMPRS